MANSLIDCIDSYFIGRLRQYLHVKKCADTGSYFREWNGLKIHDSSALFLFFQAFIPASVMLPPKRLMTLLDQSAELQTERCLHHSLKNSDIVSPLDPSFLTRDHKCPEDEFPCETLQILRDHHDEVWYCRWVLPLDGDECGIEYKKSLYLKLHHEFCTCN